MCSRLLNLTSAPGECPAQGAPVPRKWADSANWSSCPSAVRSSGLVLHQPDHCIAPGREEAGGTWRDVDTKEEVCQNPVDRAGSQQGDPGGRTRDRENCAGMTVHGLGCCHVDQHRVFRPLGSLINCSHCRLGVDSLDVDAGLPDKVDYPVSLKFERELCRRRPLGVPMTTSHVDIGVTSRPVRQRLQTPVRQPFPGALHDSSGFIWPKTGTAPDLKPGGSLLARTSWATNRWRTV